MTVAYNSAAWTDFSVGVIGASATLVGLVFVAVSINLQQILQIRGLPARAGQTLVFLATPLFVALFVLTPGQSRSALAGEFLATALLTGAVHLRIAVQSDRSESEARESWLISRIVPSTGITVCLGVAGVTILAQSGGGLYWLVPTISIAILFGIVNAWVLLVEILR